MESSTVSGAAGKTGYSKGKINYLDETGRQRSKTIMSFANPKVYDVLKNATQGQMFNVTEKQQGEFTNWQAVEPSDGAAAAAPKASAPARATPAPVSQYETRDERNARQRLIVRQSSLSNAIEVATKYPDGPTDTQQILNLAETFAAWVYEQPVKVNEPSLEEMPDDIPY